ncbi:MAG: copper resistance protein B [Robiginitomaculum sp.]|nr:copper resistance protein B [Robiginitomaculum sp.]
MNMLKSILPLAYASLLGLSNLAYAQDDKTETETEELWSMADSIFGAEEMAKSRAALMKTHGDSPISFIMGDRLETQLTNGEETFVWDAQGWYGTDQHKLWIKTEGEYSFTDNEVEDAEIQALWSKPVTAFWDFQAGIRYDLAPRGRTHAVLGFQGLAPYWFEVDAAAFLSTEGDLTSRIEAEYDFILSQRLFLQPRLEVEFSAQDIEELDIGAGITGFDLGLRLRYEWRREFAPYIGVEWQKNLGETAGIVRNSGGDSNQLALIVGIRAWY